MSAVSDSSWVAPWMDAAACVGAPVTWWFPESKPQAIFQTRAAIAVCRTCQVQTECLQFALENDDQHGIYGGLLPEQRQALAQHKTMRKDKS